MIFALPAFSAEYPEHDIDGVIQWGVGGVTDVLTRALCHKAETYLNKNIKLENIPGDTGVVGFQEVYNKPADGYTLLLGAENPTLYRALKLCEQTYNDFECIYLIGDVTAGVMVRPDSKYKSFKEIIKDALANPGQLKYATTGRGSLHWIMAAFIKDITGATFDLKEYDSNGTAKEAVINGECDFTVCLLQQAADDIRLGRANFLCVFSLDVPDSLHGVPAVIDEYPEFTKYFPWGSFYGVFVKKGTDQKIVQKLKDAFIKAGNDHDFQKLLIDYNVNFLGYSGAEAERYISNWKGNTIDALLTSGAIE